MAALGGSNCNTPHNLAPRGLRKPFSLDGSSWAQHPLLSCWATIFSMGMGCRAISEVLLNAKVARLFLHIKSEILSVTGSFPLTEAERHSRYKRSLFSLCRHTPFQVCISTTTRFPKSLHG